MRRTPYPIPHTLYLSSRVSRRSAFTLIEMLIVVVISAMLSTIAIGYSSVGRNEVALSVEEATISQIILQAKSLALATYGAGSNACGYGVSFSTAAQTYSIFGYKPSGTPSCPSDAALTGITSGDMQEYTAGTWNVHISNGVVLYSGAGGDSIVDVLFYPPNPDTFVSRDGSTFISPTETSKVYLKTADGSAMAAISVSSLGQVTF